MVMLPMVTGREQEDIDAANKAAKALYGSSVSYDKPKTSPGDIKFKDINNDGRINADDRTYIGNPTPKMRYGININLTYKIFDLTIFGQGVHGNKIFQTLIYYNESPNAYWNMDNKMLSHWTPETPNAATSEI